MYRVNNVWGLGDIWENSIPSFCCEPKSALKKKVFFFFLKKLIQVPLRK